MAQYIDKYRVVAEIDSIEYETNYEPFTDEVLGKRKVCKDIKDFINTLEVKEVQEEPVSEDLGEYTNELSKQFPEVSFAKLNRIAVRVAKWKEGQLKKNRLEHFDTLTKEEAQREYDFVMGIIKNEHRIPTFDDAIKYGMMLQKESEGKAGEISEVIEKYCKED